MKKMLMALSLLFGCSVAHAAATCDAGYYSACHGGSGRGGGYRTVCSCLPNGCSLPGGGTIASGAVATFYGVSSVDNSAGDSCANHYVFATCNAGQLSPDVSTLYATCQDNNVPAPPPPPSDDNGDGSND